MSFTVDLRAFAEKTGKTLERAVVETAVALVDTVAVRTPVDTGRARANWQVTFLAPASGQVESTNAQSQLAANQSKARAWKMGSGAIFITNNLPYIERLEHGYSRQAPAGMVKVTVVEFQSIVRKVVGDSK